MAGFLADQRVKQDGYVRIVELKLARMPLFVESVETTSEILFFESKSYIDMQTQTKKFRWTLNHHTNTSCYTY